MINVGNGWLFWLVLLLAITVYYCVFLSLKKFGKKSIKNISHKIPSPQDDILKELSPGSQGQVDLEHGQANMDPERENYCLPNRTGKYSARKKSCLPALTRRTRKRSYPPVRTRKNPLQRARTRKNSRPCSQTGKNLLHPIIPRCKKLEKYYFYDIHGMDDVVKEFKTLVDIAKNRKKYTKMGAKLPKLILLRGKSGSGKTLLGKAMIRGLPQHYLSKYFCSAAVFRLFLYLARLESFLKNFKIAFRSKSKVFSLGTETVEVRRTPEFVIKII